MRAVWLWVVLAAGAARAAPAQDTVAGHDTAGAELLRVEIERRFAQRVQTDLGLSGDQMRRLKATQDRIGPRRRQLMREGLGYRLALQSQMRPGVAANPDSVKAYMDGLQRVRAAQVALDQEEDRELQGYLTPVQRAQFHMMRTRLIQRANELRRERRGRLGQRP
jgi:hypothetical protein